MNAETFNSRFPVGTLVFAYPGARPEDIPSARRLVTRTRTEAQSVGLDRDGVVWVEDHGAYISLTHVDPVSESVWQAAKEAEQVSAAVAPSGLGHATRAETVPALMATINQLRELRQPLIDALTLVHESMTSCVGDEWAMEWLGEVWTQLPLDVRALAGDQDATAELAAAHGPFPVPAGPHVEATETADGTTLTFIPAEAGERR
ncbi:hypothetical protein [Streptomyces sp. NBC_00140]|uniref:hypothetical protein n=1 Tax=Streptomyces sp. NBC_00140 TaxID=2975664 RepID=UPI00225A8D75|nr:hypothetical protein [Streptomyces sp. NBC_00140]MCX5336954.1 hypothetical protein [Streptomyces sp. NBC_00140]MCX5338437.1 hypothetical protein [Streptomyces sp. NBC_00140]